MVFKHEAVLTFVGRLTRDREFCEWFAADPCQALGSHRLEVEDLRDVAAVLQSDHRRPDVSAAMRPMIDTLVRMIEDGGSSDEAAAGRLACLDGEIQAVRERLAVARTQRRPW